MKLFLLVSIALVLVSFVSTIGAKPTYESNNKNNKHADENGFHLEPK